MDWGNDYFTFSDTNIEYIWKFLKIVQRARLALHGPPLDRVVPALRHLALPARADAVRRLPGSRRPVALRPLPAPRPRRRVRRRLDDDAVDAARERRRGRSSRRGVRAARERRMGRRQALPRTTRSSSGSRGQPSSSGWRYRGPFDDLAPGSARRASRHPVGGRDDGPGHRRSSTSRPAAAARTSSSSKVHDLAVLTPVDESGRFYDDYGWLHGISTTEAADQIIGRLGETGFLVEAGPLHACLPALLALRHAADLPALGRLVHLRRGDPAEAARGERQGRSGCPSTWGSAWTTGCATWATGTSRAAATTGCRCRSIRARAAT